MMTYLKRLKVCVRVCALYVCSCTCVPLCVERRNKPNLYSISDGLLKYSLLRSDKCCNSVRYKSNQKSTLHKPTHFFFPAGKCNQNGKDFWQQNVQINMPDPLQMGLLKIVTVLLKTVIKCNRNYCVNIFTVHNLFLECT